MLHFLLDMPQASSRALRIKKNLEIISMHHEIRQKKNMINPKPRIQQTRLMKSSNFLKKTISGIREEKDTKVLKLITLKPQTTMQRLQCNEKQQSNSSMKVLKREEKAITVRYCREKRKLTDNSFHVRKRHCRL